MNNKPTPEESTESNTAMDGLLRLIKLMKDENETLTARVKELETVLKEVYADPHNNLTVGLLETIRQALTNEGDEKNG